MLSMKKLLLIAVLMSALVFFPMLRLSEILVGIPSSGLIFFIVKVLFLSATVSMLTTIVLGLIVRWDYTMAQVRLFNRFKYLLGLLVKRDFVSRYRKSILGVLWSLLNPLLTMFVMTIVFSYFFRNEIENFPVYLLSGQVVLSFFSESTTKAMSSLIESESIIKKTYVPKYIFPVSKVLSSLVNLIFSLLAFLIVFIITKGEFRWTMLLIPLPVIYTFVFSLGTAMFLSSMAVFFRDLTYLYGVSLTLLSYLTPTFYPVEIMPEWMHPIMNLNPLFHFVDYFRAVAMRGSIPGLWENVVCIGFCLASLCLGLYAFMAKRDRYILYM